MVESTRYVAVQLNTEISENTWVCWGHSAYTANYRETVGEETVEYTEQRLRILDNKYYLRFSSFSLALYVT